MKYYGITDKGLIRKNNQDSYVIATNEKGDVFAIVADGIGGNLGGDIASRMAVAHFSKVFSENTGFTSVQEIREWIAANASEANRQIYRYGRSHSELKGMGTTLCGVMITPLGRFIINIGDSRAYAWFADGSFKLLTRDHNLVNDMILHGELTPEQARNYPHRNVITNALGVWETVRCDIDQHNEKMQGILLCSDGLHGYVSGMQIATVLNDRSGDPVLRAKKLMKLALEAGGYDNITVVLIDLEGDDR